MGVRGIAERFQVRRTKSVKQGTQLIARITEYGEACSVLVDEYELAVGANKSLVNQNTTFTSSGFNHLASQRLKVVELAGFDCQLDKPRNLIAHFDSLRPTNMSALVPTAANEAA